MEFDKDPVVVEGHSDAIWNSDLDDSKSVIAWIFTLAEGAISWKSERQMYLTHSSMELEFVAQSSTEEKAEWLRNVLVDVPIWDKSVPALTIYYDNQAIIFKVDSKNYNEKSMTERLKHNHVKGLIADGIMYSM